MFDEEEDDEYTTNFNKELATDNAPVVKRVYKDTASSKANGADPKVVRIWAVANNIALPVRGRFPASVVKKYLDQQ
jgi:hypothetical protein